MSRLTDPFSRFPSFNELPPPSSSPSSKYHHVLLAQIKEDMTITKPTLIVTDRTGVDFALVFEDEGVSLKERGFRKGCTILVPNATRTERGAEGKKAIVRVPGGEMGDVEIIPGHLDRVLELCIVLEATRGPCSDRCAACGKAGGKLMKCTGCGISAYCGKECQVNGWTTMDHKSNCLQFGCMLAMNWEWVTCKP
ncbi:hypothetical protein F5Y17DRAFT_265819 [Xylariaceae sp. FL0594]|nr:hypothetical protein F5Y17DRAFT_265819 [Xylariaceae sp. FL0594]